jgi:sterol 3beta-glucosyltransferase
MLAAGDVMKLFEHLARLERDANGPMVDAMIRAAEGADVILSTGLTLLRGVVLAEKFDKPHRVLCLQPITPTVAFPHFLLPFANLGWGTLNRYSYGFVFDRIWSEVAGSVNAMRRTLGLPAWQRRPKVEHSLRSINLYSELLVPPPKDCTAHAQPGFIRLQLEDRERLGEASIETALDTWLAEGEAPIYFGFGSMPVLDPGALLGDIAGLCEELNTRALVGAGWTQYDQSALGERVFVAKHFNHDVVLPRCVAAVHHGGAGTTHSVLAAGLPSLVCPIFSDQPFWARRLEQLEVGLSLPFRQLNRRSLAVMLPQLMHTELRQRAATLGNRLRQEEGALNAVHVIANLAQGQVGPSDAPLASSTSHYRGRHDQQINAQQ